MKIHFFGRAGDRIARSVEIDVPSDVASVGALRIFLADAFPDAANEIASPALRACVGGASKVPLGFVSLTENLMMIGMAIWMTMM